MNDYYLYEYRSPKGKLLYIGRGRCSRGLYGRAKNTGGHKSVSLWMRKYKKKVSVNIIAASMSLTCVKITEALLIRTLRPLLNVSKHDHSRIIPDSFDISKARSPEQGLRSILWELKNLKAELTQEDLSREELSIIYARERRLLTKLIDDHYLSPSDNVDLDWYPIADMFHLWYSEYDLSTELSRLHHEYVCHLTWYQNKECKFRSLVHFWEEVRADYKSLSHYGIKTPEEFLKKNKPTKDCPNPHPTFLNP